MPKSKKQKRESKTPGVCAFCGRRGLSDEHIWSTWTHDLIKRDSSHHTIISQNRSADNFPGSVMRNRQGGVITRRVRKVCKKCNSGWMSAIEEQAKPYLGPLILGQKITIHEEAQKVISLWAALKSMIIDLADYKLTAVPQEHRTFLREKLSIPNGWMIWMGFCVGDVWHSSSVHTSITFFPPPEVAFSLNYNFPPRRNTQITTMGIGRVLFHIHSSIFTDSILPYLPFVPPTLTPLWPLAGSQISWPPGSFIDDAAAYSISNIARRIANA